MKVNINAALKTIIEFMDIVLYLASHNKINRYLAEKSWGNFIKFFITTVWNPSPCMRQAL